MNNKKFLSIFAIMIAVVFLLNSSIYADSFPVKTTAVEKGQISISEKITAKFTPYKTVQIPVQTSGVVDELNVDVGDLVEKDEVLLKLNQDKLTAQLKQAEANLKAAQAKLEELQNGATEEEIAKAEASYEQAQASLESAQINYKYAQTTLNDKRSIKQALNDAKTKQETAAKQLDAAKETYNQAQNDLEKAQNDFERIKSLYEEEATTREQYDNYKTALENARSRLASAKSNLESVKISYQGAEINYQIAQENYQSPTQLNQQLESAQNQIAIAQANVNLAKASLDDLKNGTRLEEIAAAKANVLQLEAAVRLSKLNLEDTVVQSPLAGSVAEVNPEVGEMVNDGSTVVTVIETNKLYAEAFVTADLIKDLHKGDQVKVKAKVFSEFSDGIIERVAPTVDQQKQTYLVKVRVDNQENQLMSGMFADVYFTSSSEKETIVVPLDAVLDVDSNPHVFKVINHKAVRVNVKTGIINGDKIEILKGLTEKDQIIVSGQNNVVDGDRVEVVE
ncbi:efflux RND transporter periplasmic adaptor subunit [Halocella sp. SP3-1]|uniref:efflux RND transporter periplasmic adaptor subunit n=1 Tax=Halocella sp. SP3-1 TaxID=2382161 RepID=UPI000F755964|nr:efflux RND transporter periplasmic adaptor subunit [Halocella sp. SP3-1]AZO94265.1 efflux RND transporter periplasmic adaptor subunit [Halocella sp. SP3-1]